MEGLQVEIVLRNTAGLAEDFVFRPRNYAKYTRAPQIAKGFSSLESGAGERILFFFGVQRVTIVSAARRNETRVKGIQRLSRPHGFRNELMDQLDNKFKEFL